MNKLIKGMIGLGLTFWAIGIGIALYVGFSVIVLDKDFGGKGRVGSKHRHHMRMHR